MKTIFSLNVRNESPQITHLQKHGSFTLANSDSDTDTNFMKLYYQWVSVIYFSVSEWDLVSVNTPLPLSVP